VADAATEVEADATTEASVAGIAGVSPAVAQERSDAELRAMAKSFKTSSTPASFLLEAEAEGRVDNTAPPRLRLLSTLNSAPPDTLPEHRNGQNVNEEHRGNGMLAATTVVHPRLKTLL
jgi:hypothetical protein